MSMRWLVVFVALAIGPGPLAHASASREALIHGVAGDKTLLFVSVAPGIFPASAAPEDAVPGLGACPYPAGLELEVGGVPYTPMGAFLPGVGSLAARESRRARTWSTAITRSGASV